MNSHHDLVAFLHDRLAEDEAVAKAAEVGPWRVGGEDYEGGWAIIRPDGRAVAAAGYVGGGVWERPSADHIARHDPARGLAEVESKRRIVKKCAQALEYYGDHGGAPEICEDILHFLTIPYQSHVDFSKEWLP